MNIFLFLIAQYYYSWTHYTDIKDTKVVILGQDPYHGPSQAHGLCFSVQKGVPAPPSLVNMYKELKKENETLKQELETLETGREELQSKVEDFYLIYYI